MAAVFLGGRTVMADTGWDGGGKIAVDTAMGTLAAVGSRQGGCLEPVTGDPGISRKSFGSIDSGSNNAIMDASPDRWLFVDEPVGDSGAPQKDMAEGIT
jgi:hypothetical protein